MTGAHVVSASGVECLSRMPECELADGAPDVRGWEVTSATSAHLGVVRDLLVDLATMRVRYLDVVLDTDREARRVLIPIGKAWINDVLDQVVIAAPLDLDALPAFEPDSFNREFEQRVLALFGESGSGDVDLYASSAFDGAHFGAVQRRAASCDRRETDAAGDGCPADGAPEAANGVELPVVTDEAAD